MNEYNRNTVGVDISKAYLDVHRLAGRGKAVLSGPAFQYNTHLVPRLLSTANDRGIYADSSIYGHGLLCDTVQYPH